jgi:hypothetical protein
MNSESNAMSRSINKFNLKLSFDMPSGFIQEPVAFRII